MHTILQQSTFSRVHANFETSQSSDNKLIFNIFDLAYKRSEGGFTVGKCCAPPSVCRLPRGSNAPTIIFLAAKKTSMLRRVIRSSKQILHPFTSLRPSRIVRLFFKSNTLLSKIYHVYK